MRLYRLYTESKPNLAEMTSKYFDSFTLIPAQGYWQRQAEDSMIIEVLTDQPYTLEFLHSLANDIIKSNNQQAVILTSVEVEMTTYAQKDSREVRGEAKG